VIDPPGVLERINEALPANVRCESRRVESARAPLTCSSLQFRAYSVTRVTNGFSAKNMCDRRRYRYVLPEWALHASASCEADAAALPPMPDATLAQLNALLARFVGTHSFHNFTPRCAAGDRSALRYILSCSAMPARTVHGLRVVTLEVLGQSFMLHQIRKMVGATLCIIRGVLPVDFLDRALLKSSQPIFTPMAPDLGLYLCECIFGAYNERWAGSHEQLSLAGCGDAPAEFERQKVLGHIVATEQREGVFAAWLRELLEHRGAAPEETAGGDDDGGEDEEAHDSETRGGGRGRGRQGQRSRATDVEKDVRSPPAAAAAVSDAG